MGRGFIVVAAVWTCVVWSLPAQTTRAVKTTPPVHESSANPDAWKFEVVSIKPSPPDEKWMFGIVGDEYRAIARPLAIVIGEAYFPFALIRRQRIVGAPAWIWKDQYDFVGKVDPNDFAEWEKMREHYNPTVANPMMQAMLQAALADRCKLAVHHIPGEMEGYALVLRGKATNSKTLKVAAAVKVLPQYALKIPGDGRMVPILSSDDPELTFLHTSMASLSAILSNFGAPVEDRTGLKGEYDFRLLRLSTTGDPGLDWNVGALGLKLVKIKLPAESIVIDHIERPSPN